MPFYVRDFLKKFAICHSSVLACLLLPCFVFYTALTSKSILLINPDFQQFPSCSSTPPTPYNFPSLHFNPLPPAIRLVVVLTSESPLGQKLLRRPVEHQDLEGVFLTGIQSRHCCPGPCGGQHQLWLGNLWERQKSKKSCLVEK